MRKTVLTFVLAAIIVISTACSSGNISASSSVASAQSVATSKVKDGVYAGSAKGYGGDVTVDVTIKSEKITDVKVTNQNETTEYGGKAVEKLPAQIVEKGTLDIDATVGATITSRAILQAVANAITTAGADPKDYLYTAVSEISATDIVEIIGLPDGTTYSLTGAQLKKMPAITVKAQSINSKGVTTDISATGVKLETVLNYLSLSQKDYEGIITSSNDGYSVEIPNDILQNRDVIIAWEVNGEAQSPRTIVPDERAMYWVKFLSTIELKGQSEKVQVDTLTIMETMLATKTAEDYKYYESTDKAVAIQTILNKENATNPEYITISSLDGLAKNEKFDTVLAQYIKFTGEGAPMFIGLDLSEGMRVKDILTMQVASENFVSIATAKKYKNITEEQGIPLKDLFEIAGMAVADSYTFTAADDYSVDISKEDILKGIVLIDENTVKVQFEGLAKNTTVKDLLQIKQTASK